MLDIVISDTSSLIILEKIGELNLLQRTYSRVVTTPQVAEEFREKLPSWIVIKVVQDRKYQEFLETQVDRGEASAIALAKENGNSLLLLDDLKARKLAHQLNLKFTGTLGVFHKAKGLGIIDKIKPLIDKILMTDFRVSEKIINELLRLNNELP